VLQEVGSVLARLQLTATQIERRLRAMRETFPEAMVTIPDHLEDGLTCIPDPKDRHVLAAAIAGRANAILTLNRRDFPPECLAQYDIERMSPDDFLVHQYHLNPENVLDKIDAQATAIRETRKTVVNRFRERLQAPKFADFVESKDK
jgi:PIN domain